MKRKQWLIVLVAACLFLAACQAGPVDETALIQSPQPNQESPQKKVENGDDTGVLVDENSRIVYPSQGRYPAWLERTVPKITMEQLAERMGLDAGDIKASNGGVEVNYQSFAGYCYAYGIGLYFDMISPEEYKNIQIANKEGQEGINSPCTYYFLDADENGAVSYTATENETGHYIEILRYEAGYRMAPLNQVEPNNGMPISMAYDESFLLAKRAVSQLFAEYVQHDDMAWVVQLNRQLAQSDEQALANAKASMAHSFLFRHRHESGAAIEAASWDKYLEGIRVRVTNLGVACVEIGWHDFAQSEDELDAMPLHTALLAVGRQYSGANLRLIYAEPVFFAGEAPGLLTERFTPHWKIQTDQQLVYVSMETGAVFTDEQYALLRMQASETQALLAAADEEPKTTAEIQQSTQN